MIKDLVQIALDEALYEKGIFVHEPRKSGPDADEYVVYSTSGDSREFYADDVNMTRNASITVKYYYRAEKLDNYSSRQKVREIENLIETALEEAGFEIPYGKFDAGDIDDIGYMATIFECEYWRVV